KIVTINTTTRKLKQHSFTIDRSQIQAPGLPISEKAIGPDSHAFTGAEGARLCQTGNDRLCRKVSRLESLRSRFHHVVLHAAPPSSRGQVTHYDLHQFVVYAWGL